MTWHERWRALAARIDGLIRAVEFLATAFKVSSADNFRVLPNSFKPELDAITTEIEQMRTMYASELPENASRAIKRYLDGKWNMNLKEGQEGKVGIQAFAPLAAFRSELEYLVRDSEVEGRSLTELAFEHLRRQLVVDDAVREKWRKAYNDHETACEKLGGVHLLSHGIWAFKVSAPGGATDLVFADPLDQRLQVARRVARALVLTEWKLVRESDKIESKAGEARAQASNYIAGVLGDIEVRRTRYIILVCKSDSPPPADVPVNGIVYRHIVIATNPQVPSAAARKRKPHPGSP